MVSFRMVHTKTCWTESHWHYQVFIVLVTSILVKYSILHMLILLIHFHITREFFFCVNCLSYCDHFNASMHFCYNKFKVKYGPKRCQGIGLSDGEATERMWSYLRRFSAITKEMTASHRIDTLTLCLLHYMEWSKAKLGMNNYSIIELKIVNYEYSTIKTYNYY